MPRRFRALVLSAGMASVAVLAAAPAQATFPGTNGRIAFSQEAGLAPDSSGGRSQIFTISPGGGGLTQLTHVAPGQAAGVPDWSPDGEHIAYESNESGAFHVWVMDANGAHQTQLTDDDGFEDFQPTWSPNGKRLVFSHCGEPFGFVDFCDIATIKADGTGFQALPNAGHWTNLHPVYSPDGTRIAFDSDRGGRQSAIWVMNADGSSPQRLTSAKLRAFWPDWAPDGKRILFSDNCCLPHSNLWTVRPDGTKLIKLTNVPKSFDAAFGSFSPNGERIVARISDNSCGNSGCDHFYTMRADGSHFHRVVTGKANTFNTDWGPGS